MHVVLDTNVLISSLINREGIPAIVANESINNKKYTLIITDDIFDELKRVLKYSKVRKFIAFSDDYLKEWMSWLQLNSFIVVPRFKYAPIVLEDLKDDIYLIAALEGNADYIITGDKHLLDLHPYQGIPIVNPSTFLDLVNIEVSKSEPLLMAKKH